MKHLDIKVSTIYRIPLQELVADHQTSVGEAIDHEIEDIQAGEVRLSQYEAIDAWVDADEVRLGDERITLGDVWRDGKRKHYAEHVKLYDNHTSTTHRVGDTPGEALDRLVRDLPQELRDQIPTNEGEA